MMRHARRELVLWWLLLLLFNGAARAQQAVVAQRFVVSSGHAEATAAGLRVLRSGGNVVDAAIATSLALGVAEPYASGLGGKLVLLFREASTGRVTCIEALCPSAAAIDPAAFSQLSRQERYFGYKAVGVPGCLAGLAEAHQRWGRHPWSKLVQPAIDLAERGVDVTPKLQSFFDPSDLRSDPETARIYLVDGNLHAVGSRLRNPDLAASLRLIRDDGGAEFYDGQLGRLIVEAAQAAGASLELDDFRRYRPRVTEPLVINYRGYCVYSSPPPLTGGVTLLAALELLERLPTRRMRRTQLVDEMGRALQTIYPRVAETVADVPTARADAHDLLWNLPSAAERPPLFERTGRVAAPPTAIVFDSSEDLPEASTSHLCVMDAEGNMVSLTQSLSLHFGAGVTPPGTGIVLNNSMSNFATRNANSVNYVAAGKRARSTIAPVLVTRCGRPCLALGIPGGQRIPTTTLQLLHYVLDEGQSLQMAMDQPRFHLRRPRNSDEPANRVDLEDGAPSSLAEQLQERGWSINFYPRDGHYFGGGNAIARCSNGTMMGVADTRRTNFADGD